MAKPIKPRIIRGHVLNIKLVSNERSGEEVLESLFKLIKEKKLIEKVSNDRDIMIRTLFNGTSNKMNFIYGKFVSAIDLSNETWLNTQELEKEDIEIPIPENHLAKVREVEYIFIPNAHRLFIISASHGIPYRQISKFMYAALIKVIASGEDVIINTEKDADKLNEIFKSKKVEWVEFNISKSNNDNHKASAKLVEDMLTKSGANVYSGKFQNLTGDGLNIESDIIAGALKLSESNGSAKARIQDENGKSETVDTSEHDKSFKVEVSNPQIYNAVYIDIFNYIRRRFRENND